MHDSLKKADNIPQANREQSAEKELLFGRLTNQYCEPIYRYIRRMVTEHETAEDLCQDVFLKAWEALDGLREKEHASAWLYRIAFNTTVSHLRRKKISNMVRLTNQETEFEEKLRSDIFFNGDEAEIIFRIALSKLPAVQRAVFLLRYNDELSFSEIARIRGKSEGGVKASYHHAQEKIRKYLLTH
jgi:RNA polymerase sigma factor (sigma-70 family)